MIIRFLCIMTIVLRLSISSYGQEVFQITDTINLSGVFIYDTKKNQGYICKNYNRNPIRSSLVSKYMIILKSKKLLEPISVSSIEMRVNGKEIKFCKSVNANKYLVDFNNLISERFYIAPFENDDFMRILYNNKEYYALKCKWLISGNGK